MQHLSLSLLSLRPVLISEPPPGVLGNPAFAIFTSCSFCVKDLGRGSQRERRREEVER